MKTCNKILIFGIIIILILFLLYNCRNKIKENFSNPTPFLFDDNKKMNVVIISFFYSDTCPESREFLYGCCRDIEGDKEQIQDKLIQYQQKDELITDSYGNKLRNWYSNSKNDNFIKKNQDMGGKCISINNFEEVDGGENTLNNNKCFLRKKPTFHYLQSFINKFNNDYVNDLKINTIKEGKFTDDNGKIDISEDLAKIENLKFEIRLRVEEYKNKDEISTLFIEVPRVPGLKAGDNILRSRHRYLGNLNNMNEIGEFINKFLNIKIVDKKTIHFFSNNIEQNSDSYKKKIVAEGNFINNNLVNQEYISYLYKKYQEDDFKNLEGEFSHIAPQVATYDFNSNSRQNDVEIRQLENNYIDTRPKILWKNIVTFPEPNNEFIAIIFRDVKLEETYIDDPEKLIYWMMWNVPKKSYSIPELKYDKIDNDSFIRNEIKEFCELYPYKIFDKTKNQYYFDTNNIKTRDFKMKDNNVFPAPSPTPSEIKKNVNLFEIFNVGDRIVEYNVEIYNYNSEEAKEIDKYYDNYSKTNIELFYEKMLNLLKNKKVKESAQNNIKFKIEDDNQVEDLGKYLKNSNYKDDEKNNIYQNTLTTFSYGMNYYKLDNNSININLEKHTYWVLYFYVKEEITVYINSDKVKLNGKHELRLPYKTNFISIKKNTGNINEEDYVVIKESKVPTYRLNWQDIFYQHKDLFDTIEGGIKIKEERTIDGVFRLENEISEIKFNYRVNFEYESINVENIKINDKQEDFICPSSSCDSNKLFINKLISVNNNQMKFKITVKNGSILYNGTVSPIEENNDLMELEEIENVKQRRISSINLDSLGCNYRGEYVNQPVPPIRCDYKINTRNKSLRFAVRIYENDKLKPLYIQWGIEDLNNVMNYELFRNNQNKNIIQFTDYEMKFKSKNSNKYFNKKANDNCKKNTKLNLKVDSKIILKNLPLKVSQEDLEFTKDTKDGVDINTYKNEEMKYSLIYNKVKEVWQMWKHDGGFLYSWVGEQKYSDSLVKYGSWVFAPKYDNFTETRFIDPIFFPSWYNRNTLINSQNIYSTYLEKTQLLEKDSNITYVYQKNIMITLSNTEETEFYDCNLGKEEIIFPKPSSTDEETISPPPSYNQETLMFTNSLFTLGNLEKIEFNYKEGKSYFHKTLKLEVIPYYKEQVNIEDYSSNIDKYIFNPYSSGFKEIEHTYEYVLSEKIKERYINHNFISDLVNVIYSSFQGEERAEIFNKITDNILIYRGNLKVLEGYFETSKIEDIKSNYYGMEEESIHSNKEPIIVFDTLTLDQKINKEKNEKADKVVIPSDFGFLFEQYVNHKKNKIYFENYQSFGNLAIYQNETILNYVIPTVEKINQLCPSFRNYIAKTQETLNTDLLHKTNIVIVINYYKIYQQLISYYLKELNYESIVDASKEKEIDILQKIFSNKKYGDIIYPINEEELNKIGSLQGLIDNLEVIGELKPLIKSIQEINNEDLYIKNTEITVPCPSSSCEEDCHPSSSDNCENDLNKNKYLRDIFVPYLITRIINDLVLKKLEDIENSSQTNINIVNELLAIMERFYLFTIERHNLYFEEKNDIFDKLNPNNIDDGLSSFPPSFYTEPTRYYSETIDSAVNSYRTMIQNVFGI